MEGTAMSAPCRVLIVDSSEETRVVLQTVLERHGVTTMASGRLNGGLTLARANQPDLIVLDIESVDAENRHLLTPLLEPSETEQPQWLFLGTFRRQEESLPNGEFVSKPYQYGALIRKIEELLHLAR
jgi:CheY-like chemotaxis protein